jgi:UDP-4-amino-4,6-dideoxy-N-acetyl-beta-L-altrosamine transaminase
MATAPRRAEPALLPYGRQRIDEDDIAAVADVLRGDWLTQGPMVARFERALAERLGAAHATACSNGTAALHLAALALELGPDDTVVVPSVTFLATANAVRMTGAEVVFADVDPDNGLMGITELATAVDRAEKAGRRVAAAFLVHLTGQCGDVAAISAWARPRGIALVEDACHALGSWYAQPDGSAVPVGSCRSTDLAIFSFHPVKTVATGEGGAVLTNDPRLKLRLDRLRSHGIVREADELSNDDLAYDSAGAVNPWYYEMPELGWNYRLPDINCALGLSQLGKLDRFVEERRGLAQRYDALLAPLAGRVQPIRRMRGCLAAWHLYAVLIDFDGLGVDRAQVMQQLRRAGIGTQVHYIPVHRQPYYLTRYGRTELPGAEAYYRRTLSLPLFVGMTVPDVKRVVAALEEALPRPNSARRKLAS